MFESVIKELFEYFGSGGYVMPPLILIMLISWYGLGYRYSVIKNSSHKQGARALLESYFSDPWDDCKGVVKEAILEAVDIVNSGHANIRDYLDVAFWKYEKQLNAWHNIIRTLVISAPLLGLLGTVSGMIETFDSLQDMSLVKQDGGIAAGISQALITTQFGLAVAIPAMLVNSMIDKRKQAILLELAQIKDLLIASRNNSVR